MKPSFQGLSNVYVDENSIVEGGSSLYYFGEIKSGIKQKHTVFQIHKCLRENTIVWIFVFKRSESTFWL